MRYPYRLEPKRTVEEALERARVPELQKVVYLPGPPPSAWQVLTSAAASAWRTIARSMAQARARLVGRARVLHTPAYSPHSKQYSPSPASKS
jgi:hypothetical protein